MFSGCPRRAGRGAAPVRRGRRHGVPDLRRHHRHRVADGSSGKTPGTDLREGVHTLPVLYALRRPAADADRLRVLLAGPITDDAEVAEALELLRAGPAWPGPATCWPTRPPPPARSWASSPPARPPTPWPPSPPTWWTAPPDPASPATAHRRRVVRVRPPRRVTETGLRRNGLRQRGQHHHRHRRRPDQLARPRPQEHARDRARRRRPDGEELVALPVDARHRFHPARAGPDDARESSRR